MLLQPANLVNDSQAYDETTSYEGVSPHIRPGEKKVELNFSSLPDNLKPHCRPGGKTLGLRNRGHKEGATF